MKLTMFKSLSCMFFLLPVMAGCLKDKDFEDGNIQSFYGNGTGEQKVVQISLTASSTNNHVQFAFNNINRDTSFRVAAILLAGAPAKEDVKVTIKMNPEILDTYNHDHGTTHQQYPTKLYSIANPGDSANGYVVTIPRGSNTGYLVMTVNPSRVIGSDYALGMKIGKVEPSGYISSSNFATGIAGVGTKNQYDGIYDFKGFILRAEDPILTGNFTGQEAYLITAGAYSNRFAQVWSDGSGVSGIDNLTVTIDPTTNKVKMSSANPTLVNMPGYDSRYDPATRSYYVSFYWTPAGPSNRMATDTMIYKGPRP